MLFVVRREGRRFWVDRVGEGTETVAGPLSWGRALEVAWEFVLSCRHAGREADLTVRMRSPEQVRMNLGLVEEPSLFMRTLMAALDQHTVLCVAVYVGVAPGKVRRWAAEQVVPKGRVSNRSKLVQQFREMASVRDCPCCDVLLRARWLAGFGPHVAPRIQGW